MKQLLTTVFLLLAIGTAWAQTSTDEFSKSTLVGTWQHVSTSKSAESKGKPLGADIDIKWTFDSTGNGVYAQKVPALKGVRTNPMKWTLEEKTIVLNGKVKYTVMSFDGDTMVWKNHRLGDFYHLERR